jgi:predicted glycosyltransferase
LRPHVVVIDRFPFGRHKFHQEIVALLDDTRAEPRPIVASSLHDLPANRGVDDPAQDDRAREFLSAYFDLVLVHTDPRFATLDDAFQPSRAITVPVHHTGFVVGEQSEIPQPERRSGVLVSGGGGRFGERLYATALEAHAFLEPPATSMTIVTGPSCSADVVADLERKAAPRGIRIVRAADDLPGAMRRAEVSVSQCGYTTAVDIVRAGVPAVVVPFDEGCESEQLVRAERLQHLGAVRVVRASKGARGLAAAIDAARRSEAPPSLDLDGADRSASILLSAVAERRARFPFAEPI